MTLKPDSGSILDRRPIAGVGWVASLLLAALLAGLATAWIFGATELNIRYWLIPDWWS